MGDDGESGLIYQLGASDKKCSILSLKANSRLLKVLQEEESEAWIEFTSTSSAKVTIGTEEYDLSFCDTKPTDAYLQEDWIQMNRLGEVQGRLQITNSRSSGAKESAVSATVEKLNLYPDSETKKREISLLDIGSGLGSLPSERPPESNKKPKISHTPATNTTATPGTATPKRKPASHNTEVAHIPLAQPTFDLTSPMLLLGNIPVEVAASDVLATLFSGLSIAAMYVCSHTPQKVLHRTDDRYVVSRNATVDLYVEFSFIRGAELAMIRDGEELSYKSLSTPNTTSSTPSHATSNTTSSSSSASAAKQAYTRKQVAPILQPVDQLLAFWVRSVGIKLSTTSSSVGQGLAANTPIMRCLEVLADNLHSISLPTSANSTIVDVLSDPVALARHWQDVASQLLLPSGSIDAYSADHTLKVRISKDTQYLYRNPAVDDILLAHLTNTVSSSVDDSSGFEGFLSDAGVDGLYSIEDDIAYFHYNKLVGEAEQQVTYYSTLWSQLNLCSTSTVSVGDGNNKFLHDFVTTRLQLFRALYKLAWSLCTTYSVIK